MSDLSRMQELAQKWLNGTITENEKQEFEAWYNSQPDKDSDGAGSIGSGIKKKTRIALDENASQLY